MVKKVLSLFGSGREEDKLTGYLSFLKIGPQLLKFLPGKKARDLRTWLTVYGYWNQVCVGHMINQPAAYVRGCCLLGLLCRSSGLQIMLFTDPLFIICRVVYRMLSACSCTSQSSSCPQLVCRHLHLHKRRRRQDVCIQPSQDTTGAALQTTWHGEGCLGVPSLTQCVS